MIGPRGGSGDLEIFNFWASAQGKLEEPRILYVVETVLVLVLMLVLVLGLLLSEISALLIAFRILVVLVLSPSYTR